VIAGRFYGDHKVMKKVLVLTPLLVLAWGVRGLAADDDQLARFDKATAELIKIFKSTADTLATVKDESSANAAAPKLKKVGEELRALQKKMQDLGQPTKDQKEKLKEKYKKEMEAAQSNLYKEVRRVRSVPGGKKALEELKEKKKDSGGK
jgi:hypothetical protein